MYFIFRGKGHHMKAGPFKRQKHRESFIEDDSEFHLCWASSLWEIYDCN